MKADEATFGSDQDVEVWSVASTLTKSQPFQPEPFDDHIDGLRGAFAGAGSAMDGSAGFLEMIRSKVLSQRSVEEGVALRTRPLDLSSRALETHHQGQEAAVCSHIHSDRTLVTLSHDQP